MKLQFIQVNRPKITVEVVWLRKSLWALRFANHGVVTAYNLSVVINKEFIDSLPEPEFRNIAVEEIKRIRTVGVNQHYDLYFGGTELTIVDNLPPIIGRINYRGIDNSVFVDDFTIELNSYTITCSDYSADSEIDELKKAIQAQTKELKQIRIALSQYNNCNLAK